MGTSELEAEGPGTVAVGLMPGGSLAGDAVALADGNGLLGGGSPIGGGGG
jgi:hypothetical protein